MKNSILKIIPVFIQEAIISAFNILSYQKRYGGKYKLYLSEFRKNRDLSLEELKTMQDEKYRKFIKHVIDKSKFYKEIYQNIEGKESLSNIYKLPIVTKEVLRENITQIRTIDKKQGIVSKTGGTTGKSLEVLFTLDNMQERFAMLDDFRGRFGYRLGEKTAWFSGKNLLTSKDISVKRFWKMDYWHKVRYYSTFHIKDEFLKFYVDDLIKFKPNYMVGFPSTILEIAKYGLKQNINFPANIVKAIFPTAETITKETKQAIETFFKTSVYDQYASSEGAPFIFECTNHNLHLELQSGVFEVLNEYNEPANSGRLIVTSFTTEGTPLIRYDIGDTIELSNKTCNCGNNNPLVNQILGRIDDYIYSPENGKINLGNVSNTLKDTKGIIRFQVIQDDLNKLVIKVVIDNKVYNDSVERKFLLNWRDRVGNKMQVRLDYVEDIPVEKSGKFRIVKNNIKYLIN